MSENQPANVQLETNNNGTVSFATDVIATIVGLATTEVEGVNSMYGGSSTSLADIFSRRGNNTKGLTRGVRVDMADNALSVAVTIIVDYGFPVPDIAKSIQENVKKAVAEMGLPAKVEYITDMQKVMEYGVMSMPAVVVNEKVVSMGKVLKAADVEKLLRSI